VLVVHSLDRLARNAEDLLRTVRELNGRGVTVEFIKDGLTFPPKGGPAAARLLLTVLAAVAEMERALIRERQREGIELAKKRGAYKGGKPKLTKAQVVDLQRRAAQPGANKAALAREYAVSRETLYQYLRAKP
jgi:DNA invertase Pin-like site-specific DNA recombinase